nr:TrbI/VirB10 family protein [Caulobacter sp. UNC358MFTsu5.1]
MSEAPGSGAPPPSGAEPAAKAQPEALGLRAKPRPVVRFRRGLLIGVAAVGALGVTGFAWLALSPKAEHRAVAPDEPAVSDRHAPADVMAAMPRDYSAKAPPAQLGPPLPGDLGHAVVDQERRRLQVGAGGIAASAASTPAQQAAEAERQRLAAEAHQARASGVLVQTSAPATAPGVVSTAGAAIGSPAASVATAQDDPNRQQQKTAFLERPAQGDVVSAHSLEAPRSPYTVMAGCVIAASLITGLDSDLPGLIIAQVTENVFDTVTGRYLLIPQGARLIGSYDSVVAFGQRRALVVWQRLILPDGSSIQLDNLPATDAAGYAGLSDQIDFHTWQLLKGVGLSTLLGVGTELSLGSGESDLVRAVRQSTQQSTAQAGQQIVSKQLDVQPTLKVRPGWPLRIVVHKDLILRPWRG